MARTPVPASEDDVVESHLVVDPSDDYDTKGPLDYGEDEEDASEGGIDRSIARRLGLDPDAFGDGGADFDTLLDLYSQDQDKNDDQDNQNEEDPVQSWLSESGYDAQDTAPWSPVPTAVGKKWVQKNEDAQIDIVFPTVYEEDRTAKLKDLGTANALAAITHRRMAEQMAKELGFEQYDYDDEMQQIKSESKLIGPNAIGIGDDIASSVVGLNVGQGGKITPKKVAGTPGPGGGSTGPAGSVINAPAPGMAAESPDQSEHRADLSGDSTRSFRRQQRSTSGV